MAHDRPKDWRELCKAAADEQDPHRLQELIVEINKALEELRRKERQDKERKAHAERAKPNQYAVTISEWYLLQPQR